MKLIKSFLKYQQERFPLLFLLPISLSGVIGAAAILGQHNWVTIISATCVTVAFIFHIRVIDEIRDFTHDTEFHPDRPIQKKTISIKELKILRLISLFIFFMISIIFSLKTFMLAVLVFLYSSLAGHDFFCSKKIRKYFYLYNLLNMVQLVGLQLIVYTMFGWNFTFTLIVVSHIIIVFLLSSLLEVGRKIKLVDKETFGKDTYSAHLGFRGAIILFSIIFVLVLFPLGYILSVSGKLYGLATPFFVSILGLYISVTHHFKKTIQSEKLFALFYFMYYIVINITLYTLIK
ncbi:MAG: UbiA family prenyltransferase [Candidatus Pacebacteria bacterium]|nr:UbiA family prenyltransferase [Candidatus Paceibacterota bacterium]MCF7863106.1 UbiA family prenyltransferase [Candidatus Paceibacterota bacterium]